jgi:hypothetical protein
MVGDDPIVHEIDSSILIIVRMRISADFSSTSRPTCMSQSQCSHSCFIQNFLHNSINAIYVTVSLVGIFYKRAFFDVASVSKDPCTVIASVFEEVHSIT